LRPVAALALSHDPPDRQLVPGVTARSLLAWVLGSALPLGGLISIAVYTLAGRDITVRRLAIAIVGLGGVTLVVGLFTTLLAARATTAAVQSVRTALDKVEAGDLSVRTPVFDGTQVGLLQAGFNRMVSGLREREQLREALGTYVDPSVTDRILDEGVNLAGEDLDVSVLFLDVRGFTTFAEQAPATEVVARLNELFELAVPIVVQHHGQANKFIGDGLLAVFGAPERRPDHPRCAVACALEIARAVNAHFGGGTRVGIGVNTGRAVVGTVGGGGRLEFSVIGDTVNTAARVEAATRVTGDDVLITETTLQHLADTSGWAQRPPVQLKGKERTVALYAYAPAEVF
jgi:adenylate cyclase